MFKVYKLPNRKTSVGEFRKVTDALSYALNCSILGETSSVFEVVSDGGLLCGQYQDAKRILQNLEQDAESNSF